MGLTCDVCNEFMIDNLNATGIIGRYGTVADLCTLHHAVAAEAIVRHRKVNWRALAWATVQLAGIRPNLLQEPDRWAEFMPVDRLLELYEAEIKSNPKDWPPFKRQDSGPPPDDDPYAGR